MKKYLLRGLVFGVLTIVAVIGCTDSTSIIPETEENISGHPLFRANTLLY